MFTNASKPPSLNRAGERGRPNFRPGSSDVAKRLGDDEKGIIQIDTLGGPQRMTIINEAGEKDRRNFRSILIVVLQQVGEKLGIHAWR